MSMELLASPYLEKPAAITRRTRRGRRESSTSRTCSSASPTLPASTRSRAGSIPAEKGDNAAARDAAWLEIRESIRAGHRLVGARSGARGAVVSAAAHLRVPVLLHRVRHRADGRVAGVAQLAGRTRRARRGPIAPPWAWARRNRCRRFTPRRGARLIFDAEGLAELVALVEQQIEMAEQAIPRRSGVQRGVLAPRKPERS